MSKENKVFLVFTWDASLQDGYNSTTLYILLLKYFK